MKVFILSIIFSFSLSLSGYAQLTLDSNSIFIRVYDLEGKKIAKGKRFTISDSTITFINKRKNTIIYLSEIGSIKTRRSSGHNVLLASAVVGGFGLLSDISNDESMGSDFLNGLAIGATIGLITLPFKKSKTQIINANPNKWKTLSNKNKNRISESEQDSLISTSAQKNKNNKNIMLRIYNLNGKKIAQGNTYTISDSTIIFSKNGVSEKLLLSQIGSVKINRKALRNILIPSFAFALSSGIAGLGIETFSNQKGATVAGFFGGAFLGALIGVCTIPFKKKYHELEINGNPKNWYAFREIIDKI